jgi:hypothetical protein
MPAAAVARVVKRFKAPSLNPAIFFFRMINAAIFPASRL